jgi:hypothetical protein
LARAVTNSSDLFIQQIDDELAGSHRFTANQNMTPDLQREFQLLSARATQQLKDVAASGSYRHVFSLWTLPSFSPSSRCTVYAPVPSKRDRQPFASYNIWRSDVDRAKLSSPIERLKHPTDLSPTIQNQTLWLKAGDVEQIERRIQGISIPLFLERVDVPGLDGTSFEFRYDALFFGASLRWWEGQPEAWRPFTEVVLQIAAELERRRKSEI